MAGRPRTNKYEENSSYISTMRDDGDDGGTNEYLQAKLEKVRAETKNLELKYAIQLREYVPITEVATIVSTEYTRVRSKLLALESKLPHVLAPITDPKTIKKIVQQEITEILTELSADSEYKDVADGIESAVKSITCSSSTDA